MNRWLLSWYDVGLRYNFNFGDGTFWWKNPTILVEPDPIANVFYQLHTDSPAAAPYIKPINGSLRLCLCGPRLRYIDGIKLIHALFSFYMIWVLPGATAAVFGDCKGSCYTLPVQRIYANLH